MWGKLVLYRMIARASATDVPMPHSTPAKTVTSAAVNHTRKSNLLTCKGKQGHTASSCGRPGLATFHLLQP